MRWTKSAARALASTTLLLALSGGARAQTPLPGNDKVAAQSLFEDGRALVAAGKYADACAKFADSQRLDPSPSTLLNLASCWEKLGRSATAWATYKEAESAASAAKRQDYMATAQRHADALAPKLSRLTIDVQQAAAGIQVRRDGTLVGPAEWGAAIPLDAGSHAIEAGAPGHKGWIANVDVSHDGAQLTVTVPPLEPLAAEPSPLPASPPTNTAAGPALALSPGAPAESTSNPRSQRTIGAIVAGAGVVGLGVSGALALIANGKKQDSLKNCQPDPNRNQCNATGVSQRDDALFAGDAATVAFGIGAAAIAAGAVLWLTAPAGSSAAAGSTARLFVVPALGGAMVKGNW